MTASPTPQGRRKWMPVGLFSPDGRFPSASSASKLSWAAPLVLRGL